MTSQARAHLKHFAVGALVAALGAGSYVVGAPLFSDFTAGTVISASEMNTKLKALNAAIDASAASITCPANTPTRFTDKGDGTVCDSQTGLMWEIKEECGGLENFANAHCRENRYAWSTGGTPRNGSLYTDFLVKLNLDSTADPTKTCFANHCDWRIPTIVELRSILRLSPNCAVPPCIATGFPGATFLGVYWSSSADAVSPFNPWAATFNGGAVGNVVGPTEFGRARAVRGGR